MGVVLVCVRTSASGSEWGGLSPTVELGSKSRWSCGWLVKVDVTDGDVGVSI